MNAFSWAPVWISWFCPRRLAATILLVPTSRPTGAPVVSMSSHALILAS